MNKKKPSRLIKAMLETAADMHHSGVLDAAAYKKITMRQLDEMPEQIILPVNGEEIRRLREEAHLSQAVFARRLALTAGYVSQLERGTKKLSGPALVLVDVIRRKGIEAIL